MEPLRVPAAEAQSAAAVEVVDLASDEPLEEPAVGSLGGTAEQPLQLRSSGDAFEQPPPVPRKRVRPVVELTDGDASAKPAVVLKAQPTECTICYDPCMISGRHRLVSLRCGHLFGKKCIERWITERKTCPNCNVAVRKADVRPLFSDHVAVVDNSGVEAMRQKYEDERSKRLQAETALSRSKLKMDILVAESERHRHEALRWRKEFTDLRCSLASERFSSITATASTGPLADHLTPTSHLQLPPVSSGGGFLLSQQPPSDSDTPPWNYAEIFTYSLTNSRVFAIANSCTTFCVGDELSATHCGIVKLSAVDPRHSARIIAHESPVRDLKISANEDLALTVAFDGKLVVSNLHSQSVVLQCPLPPTKRQGWSCAFSNVDPFALYCGFLDGSVAKYDMRKPSVDAVVATFTAPERQPVHSIQLFNDADGSEQLVAATFSSLSVWCNCSDCSSSSSSLAHTADARASVPGCCSLASAQTRPATILVSCRTLPQTPAKLTVFDLAHMDSDSVLGPQSVVTGHRTPQVLARSAVWEAQDGATIVASGDDESKQVLLWDAATNQVRHRVRPFPGNEVVIDVQHSVRQGSWRSKQALFGVLSAQKIALFGCAG